MVNKVRDMIDSIDEEELQKLYSDLSKGGNHLKKLVNDKIQELEESKTNYCITCGKGFGDHNASFSLVFGKNNLRKKACFCEIDCLEYFVSELKKMREKKIEKEADKYELQGNNKNI